MLFDISVNDNNQTVTFSTSDAQWTFSKIDLNNHSASWLINQLTGRGSEEIL